jgi:hypothetical protein
MEREAACRQVSDFALGDDCRYQEVVGYDGGAECQAMAVPDDPVVINP